MVVQFLKPVLAPVIRAQANRLRRVALEMPEPPGPRTGDVGPLSSDAAPLRILVAGDSSAAGVGAPTQEQALAPQLALALSKRLFRRVSWHVIAQTGLTSAGVLDLLQQSDLPQIDVAIIIVGVNDISGDVSLCRALRTRNRIAQLLRERVNAQYIIFPGLPEVERFPLLPQPLAWYGGAQARRNNLLQSRWAANPRRNDFVSHMTMTGVMHPSLMAEDGFHPSPPLYAKVAACMSMHIADRVLQPVIAA
jgi:lysophospholipase L1-like esterase